MKSEDHIHSFISAYRSAVNRGRMARLGIHAGLFLALTFPLTCLVFIFQGYAVRAEFLLVPLALALVGLALLYHRYRLEMKQSVEHADRHFDLKDSLVSAVGFMKSEKREGVHDLQIEQTAGHIVGIEPKPEPTPRRAWPWLCHGIGALLTLWFLTFDDSPAIQSAKLEAAQNLENSQKAREELTKEVEELKKDMDDVEKEILEKSGIEKLIKKLKNTSDKKESLMAMAKLEKKIRESTKREELKQDDKFLKSLAKNMKRDKESRDIAKMLAAQRYRDAAKELQKMKMSAQNLSDKKAMKKMQKLNKSMKETNQNKEHQKSGMCRSSKGLCKSMSDLEKAQKWAESQRKQGQKVSKECQSSLSQNMDKTNQSMSKFSKSLSQHSSQKQFMKKMQQLQSSLAKCQSRALAKSNKKGGQNAGVGSERRFALNKTPEANNDNVTKLTGIKGEEGDTQVKTLASSRGQGVTRRVSRDRAVEFKASVEALIERDDVPERLKRGVKTYFEDVHEPEKGKDG